MSIVIDSISGAMPTQADGSIHGKPFYFRARHGEWRIAIAETFTAVVEGESVLYSAEGVDDTHGVMEASDVFNIIWDAAGKTWKEPWAVFPESEAQKALKASFQACKELEREREINA